MVHNGQKLEGIFKKEELEDPDNDIFNKFWI